MWFPGPRSPCKVRRNCSSQRSDLLYARGAARQALFQQPRSPHKLVHNFVLKHWLPDGLIVLAQRRALALVGAPGPRAAWQDTSRILGKITRDGAPRVAFAFWLFVLNALPTSSRCQSAAAICVFGCPPDIGSDCIAHYAACPRLRRIISEATPAPSPPEVSLAGNLRFLLGGLPCSRHGVVQVATAAKLYLLVHHSTNLRPKIQRMLLRRHLGQLQQTLIAEACSIARDMS